MLNTQERLDTGIDAIDNIETSYTGDELLWQFLSEQGSSTTYIEGIELERGTDLYATGTVELETATDGGTGNLTTETETGFGAILTEESTSKYSFYIINEEYKVTTSDPLADNDWFDDEAGGSNDPVLDFTERNPFGEPTEIY